MKTDASHCPIPPPTSSSSNLLLLRALSCCVFQVSEDVELNAVWTNLLSGKDGKMSKGNTIRIRDFVPGMEGIDRVNNKKGIRPSKFTTTFNEVAAAVAKRGEVLIGWKVDGQVTINPDAKDISVAFLHLQKLIVIGDGSAAAVAAEHDEEIIRRYSIDNNGEDTSVCPRRFSLDENGRDEEMLE